MYLQAVILIIIEFWKRHLVIVFPLSPIISWFLPLTFKNNWTKMTIDTAKNIIVYVKILCWENMVEKIIIVSD